MQRFISARQIKFKRFISQHGEKEVNNSILNILKLLRDYIFSVLITKKYVKPLV